MQKKNVKYTLPRGRYFPVTRQYFFGRGSVVVCGLGDTTAAVPPSRTYQEDWLIHSLN